MAPSTNPACERFLPYLSPYIDGELTPSDRTQLERHLSACPQCTGRVADLRAESGLVRIGLEMAADEVDFSGFAQKVLARVTPEKPPLLERLRLTLDEFFTHQRGMVMTSLATAAVVLLVAVPVLLLRGGTPAGYASEQMQLQAVRVAEEAHVQPVVMEAEGEQATIIWLVDAPADGAAGDEGDDEDEDVRLEPGRTPAEGEKLPGLQAPRPQGGEL
jgi:anti-sigma factor RsiW